MTAQEECPDDYAGAPNTEPVSKVSDNTSLPPEGDTPGHSGDETGHNGRYLCVDHLAMLGASGITPEFAALRGYETITEPWRLAELNIVKAARHRVPGLLVPLLDIRGSTRGYQYRPDQPRLRQGKLVKYETPYQQANGLDIPPGVGPMLADPKVPLWITEGAKKADCGARRGLCIVDLPGVWSFIHTNTSGGKTAIPDWYDIALKGRRVILAFDGDVARKEPVQKALHALAAFLSYLGAKVEYLHLPDTDEKTGLDDYLAAGHSVEDLWRLVKPHQPPVSKHKEPPDGSPPMPKPEPVTPVPLADALDVFGKWLHIADPAPIIATAAAVVANLAPGDPVWLLIVGPSSGGKTEILSSLRGLDYVVLASTLSEASLLSGTSKRGTPPV